MKDHNKIAVNTTHLYHKHLKVLGILICKSASTATKDLFVNNYGFKRITDECFDYEKVKNAWSFAFVRNPWDRLVSVYHNKVETSLEPCFQQHPSYNIVAGMSFHAFIKQIEKIGEPPEWWDAHIRPQWHSTCNYSGKVVLDYVGRFENYNNDLQHVQKQIHLEPIRPRVLNTTKREHYRHYYNHISSRVVAKIYEQDIDLFKYSF